MRLDLSEIVADFPAFRLAVVVAAELDIPASRPPGLEAEIRARQAKAAARWQGTELADIPGVAAWRRAYRAFGIRRTSYRSSVERLMKNVLADRPLPEINAFVDSYNAVSLSHVLPAGADDRDRIAGDVAFRYATPHHSFHDMAAAENPDSPPKSGEVVYADAEKVLCRRWNWRQDARSLVTCETRRAVVTLQANGWGDPEAAAADLVALFERHCGARCAVTLADAGNARIDLREP